MIINTTKEEIQQALDKANLEFDNNLMFNNFTRLSDTRHRVTLRVKNSRGKGAKLGFYPTSKGNYKHLISACWHAHGTFFDCLPFGTLIRVTALGLIHAGDQWIDRDIGSMMQPRMFSEACEC